MNKSNALWASLVPADTVFMEKDVAIGAKGHRIEYADGSTRLCATSGLWNVPLGYGNPVISDAVTKAMHDASYLSLFRVPHRYAEDAAEALIEVANPRRYKRVIFSTSGGAANDAAMKLCRQYWNQNGNSSRSIVVGLRGSYHGTMYGSHALSGDDLLQSAYSVDRRSIRHVAHHDEGEQLETLLKREGSRVAAVVVEPVLGSGAYALSGTFVDRLLSLREKYGFLIVADEVATGFGRTGSMFSTDQWADSPDILILSKALTNGAMGAAALLIGERVAFGFSRGGFTFVHGETQAGTPVCAAAIVAVLEELQRIDVESTSRKLAANLSRMAESLKSDGMIADVRGKGCFLGLGLRKDDGSKLSTHETLRLVATIANHGVVVQPGPSSIELIPAYGFQRDEIDEVDKALRSSIKHLHGVEGE